MWARQRGRDRSHGDRGGRIENGFIAGMPGCGIAAYGSDVTVEHIHALDNGGRGIFLSGRNGVVRRCTSASNATAGIFNGGNTATEGTLTEGNVVRDNGAEGIIGSGIVRNNVVSDNAGDGIAAGQSVIEGITVRSNGGDGIAAAVSALVVTNVVVGDSGYGVAGVGDFSYRGNMISGNLLGTVSVSVGAALNTGGNACNGTLVCP